MRVLSLAIVGADYPNKRGPGRRFEIALCAPGEVIDLIPEPKNPADERAVAVFSCRGVQIGYLTAERCGWIKSLMERGTEVRAIFQHSTDYGAVIRVTLDGSEPTLPSDVGPSKNVADRAQKPPKSSDLDMTSTVCDPSVSRRSVGTDEDIGFYPDPEWPE